MSKENGRVLIVRERVNNIEKTPLNKILKEAQPNAIWLTVNNADYDKVNIGDKVKTSIDGVIFKSYPAKAKANSLTITKQ
ncbi:DUF3221 domain-containing protein [Paenibacillus sp. NPDC056579]|uniref:DUF3221 domain-containing protein n=1 Tax=Paenibacillus sp. NPDC056579 TaxID=3345871 RepID=UPI0036B78348